jgi:tetratricopeptide (TPR) repeat protein
MRREWYRVAAVGSYDGVAAPITAAIEAAEAALAAQPDSRERHRALVQALAYAGELGRAYDVAARWLERDRLDPQALVYMADVLGRQGKRDDALRLLGGVVDLAPDDAALHERLAAAHERVGRIGQACGHRIALAAIRAADARAAGAAVRCLRRLGRDADGALVLRALPSDKLRLAAEKAATAAALDPRLAGELRVVARWDGGGDLDLSLVTPQGQRVSWMGGRAGVVALDVASTAGEQLALGKLAKGRYLLELSRTAAGGATPARGTVEITALGVTRTLPFELVGDRVVVGRLAVTMASRLVPVDGPRRR